MPREALFSASKAHLEYGRRSGTQTWGLPDFLIGAQAQVLGVSILTRDQRCYKIDFAHVALICP